MHFTYKNLRKRLGDGHDLNFAIFEIHSDTMFEAK